MFSNDPRNGKILAMCSKPDFDPNDYKNADSQIYNRNLPIWKSYEPGSTFKIITFSSALNEKLFDMDKDTYYDKGYEIVKGARIKSLEKKVDMDYRLLEKFCKTRPTQDLLKLGDD